MPRDFLEGRKHPSPACRKSEEHAPLLCSNIYEFDKKGSYLLVPQAGGLEGCRKPAAKGFVLIEFMDQSQTFMM